MSKILVDQVKINLKILYFAKSYLNENITEIIWEILMIRLHACDAKRGM